MDASRYSVDQSSEERREEGGENLAKTRGLFRLEGRRGVGRGCWGRLTTRLTKRNAHLTQLLGGEAHGGDSTTLMSVEKVLWHIFSWR